MYVKAYKTIRKEMDPKLVNIEHENINNKNLKKNSSHCKLSINQDN